MTEATHDHRVCDAALMSAFGVLGKRWNGMLLGVLGEGRASFAALRRSVPGIGDTMLSERLGELVAAGLVVRAVDPGPPVSVSYALTEPGERLMPVLADLGRWASESLGASVGGSSAR